MTPSSRNQLRFLIAGLLGALVLSLTWMAIGPAGAAERTAVAAAPAGTPLVSGSGLYPRAIRLSHSASANGRIIASVMTFSGNNGTGTFSESTDDGKTFKKVGTVAPSGAANGAGSCCGSVYELPSPVGALPAGTLLWGQSVAQDATDRRMALQVYASRDTARTWTYLSTCATAPNTGGLWEPEFSVDAAGKLECYYSDETNPTAHSQSLQRVSSADGVTWSSPSAVVAPTNVGLRPGMAVVRKLPGGRYLMTYELCGSGCKVYLRSSADGSNWGTPTDVGTQITAANGDYFAHAPTITWVDNGTANGLVVLVGQMLYTADGTVAAGNGKTLMVNSSGGTSGSWTGIAAPVSVSDAYDNYCPNYSSALVPSSDGTKVTEIATGYVGTVCQPYFATGALPTSASIGTTSTTTMTARVHRTHR
jgi:hypothetical protein